MDTQYRKIDIHTHTYIGECTHESKKQNRRVHYLFIQTLLSSFEVRSNLTMSHDIVRNETRPEVDPLELDIFKYTMITIVRNYYVI